MSSDIFLKHSLAFLVVAMERWKGLFKKYLHEGVIIRHQTQQSSLESWMQS